MSGKQSALGAHKDRIKTDVRLVPTLAKRVSLLCRELGIPKNVFYTIAACDLLVRLSPLLKGNKSAILQKEIKSLLQKLEINLRKPV